MSKRIKRQWGKKSKEKIAAINTNNVIPNTTACYWTKINTGLRIKTIYSVTVDPYDSNIIYIGTDLGLFKSIEGGAHWRKQKSPCTPVNYLFINPNNTNILYIKCEDIKCGEEVFKSSNAGVYWSKIISTCSFVVSPKNPNVLYAAFFSKYYCDADFSILRSIDAGKHWSITKFTPGGTYNNYSCFLAVDPQNSNTIYTFFTPTGASTIYKSLDGGVHWHAILSPRLGCYLDFLAIDPQNSKVIYAATSGRPHTVLKSIDGGIYWSKVGLSTKTPIKRIEISSKDPSVLYAVTEKSIFKTSDAGKHWRRIGTTNNTSIKCITIDPQNPDIIYIGTSAGLFKHVCTFH